MTDQAPAAPAPSELLVIDDQQNVLDELRMSLAARLAGEDVIIRTWRPDPDGVDLVEQFRQQVGEQTEFVATDYDLTTSGFRGLFGSTIVAWCQQAGIPVGNFSRNPPVELPETPNLFELRIPSETEAAADAISVAFKGFRDLRRSVLEQDLHTRRNPAEVLAYILDRPSLTNQFSQYFTRLGAAQSSVISRLAPATPDGHDVELGRVLPYVIGHILANAILRFPGPILSSEALCAYVGTNAVEVASLSDLFEPARYTGPFSGSSAYFWREGVDQLLSSWSEGVALPVDDEDDGLRNRTVVEARLQRALATHECERAGCGGRRGGFLCPFTGRTVCILQDCSVPAAAWIPQGAHLSRVERSYHEEWAPLLGL